MKRDKKIFRVKYLFLGALLLTLLVTGIQIYFLAQQFDKTNRLTQIMLDESLGLAINKYQAEQLYSKQSDKSNGARIRINNSFTFFRDTSATSKKSIRNHISNGGIDKEKTKSFKYTWSSESGNNASELIRSFLLLINKTNQLTSVNLMTLDSTYVQTLNEKGLSIEHTMQLVDIKTKQILNQTDSLLIQKSQSLQTGSLRPITYDKSIQVVFKNPDIAVLKQMGGTIVSSAIMLILTVCCLFYYLYIISKQKKIESVREDFVHSMTHELRNPLQGAIALSEMLGNESVQSNKPMYNDVVGRIRKNLSDLNTQIETLLTLSLSDKQHTAIQPEENDLSEMLADVINTYTIISDKPVHFTLSTAPSPCICRYESMHLTNAVKNLVENAIKYSSEEVEININAFKSDEKLTIQVKDNGIGIPQDCLPNIFDQYYRVLPLKKKIKVNGFGLGLSYVKWVAEIHGGIVHAESKEGVGSTFTIEIPV